MTTTEVSNPRTGLSPLAGAGFLLRFYLRLDRVRLISWTAGFFLLIYASTVALDAAYPTQEALQGRASLMSNPAAVLMTGPAFSLDNYTLGAMLANELSLWTFIPAGIMSVLLVVRHTRADEEAGRLEVLLALPVGRYAPAMATALLALISNLLVALAVAAGTAAGGMDIANSLAFGIATGLTGLVYGAVAMVACQLTEHSRTASGMGMAAIALGMIIRGIGDVINSQGSVLSWFSPIAWAQQTRIFVDLRWWPLLLSVATIIIAIGIGIRLNRARDMGEGLRPTRPGPTQAAPALLSPAGLARRLYMRNYVAWTAGIAVFAVAFGSLASSIDTMIEDNPAIGDWVPIDLDSLTSSFAGIILAYVALGPLILLVSAILGLRTEEQNGRVEGMLVSGSSRDQLVNGWVAINAVYSIISLIILSACEGLGMVIATGRWQWVWDTTIASTAYIPAILLTAAITLTLYALSPRLAPYAWALVFFLVFDLFLGDLIQIPQWLSNLSPLTHTPLLPYSELDPVPLVIMTALALGLYLLSLRLLSRRDITNS